MWPAMPQGRPEAPPPRSGAASGTGRGAPRCCEEGPWGPRRDILPRRISQELARRVVTCPESGRGPRLLSAAGAGIKDGKGRRCWGQQEVGCVPASWACPLAS